VKRAIVLALSVILALVVAAPTVLAQDEGPPNGGAPGDQSTTYEPEDLANIPGACDFPMRIEVSGKIKTIEQGNGGIIITSPGAFATVTNVATGEQATFNITGSFHNTTDTPEPGQVTTEVRGRNFLFDPVAGTVLAIGNFNFVTDAASGNNVRPLDGEGQLIDVCALLG
jgi:hypothetical protein